MSPAGRADRPGGGRRTRAASVKTKAAVLALTRCLRVDWGPSGVGVSAVCPGVIDTPIVRRTRSLGERARAENVARVRRLFARGHSPTLVATAIIGAVEHDRSVVPVGAGARAGWAGHRLLPSRLADALARTTFGGV